MTVEFDLQVFHDKLIDMFIEFADSIFHQLQESPNNDLQMVHAEIVKNLHTMKRKPEDEVK